MAGRAPPSPELQRRAARRTALILGAFALALFALTMWALVHAK